MEEEPSEPVEGEEYEEAAPKEGRRKLVKILAVVIALAIVGGAGAWYAISVFGNSPPTADFSYSTQDLRLFVDASNSTDPDGNIATYTWDWGDGSQLGSGRVAFHDFDLSDTYRVTLTVTDARGAASTKVTDILVQAFPTPVFTARTDRMSVSFDGSGSFVLGGGQITAYSWDFGDGQTAMGATVEHTYATPGRKTVQLTVTDDRGRTRSATRLVSPAETTVEVVFDQFFQTAGCPYEDYWFLRKDSYGDDVLIETVPCTSYYPWVLFSSSPALQAVNPSYIFTIYRMDARVRNHPGYTLQDPVILPVFEPSVAPAENSYIDLDLTFDYLDTPLINTLRSTPFAVNTKYSDGFGYLVRGTITMDLTMSKRIFGVVANTPAEAQTWWYENAKFARDVGAAESRLAAWLEDLGNGKYDVYNGFEWFYETDITDLNATVAGDGTTTVTVFWDGWGYEVLLSRLFYWGRADYRAAVNAPFGQVQPEGWAPMESCWCEKSKIRGRITSAFDLDLEGVGGYVFMAWGSPGRDGLLGTSDDEPAWVFEPVLMDYVPPVGSASPGASGFPNSELKWYEGMTRPHGTPGSYAYGDPYNYITVPTRMKLGLGYSFTFSLPRDAGNRPLAVPWYDPVRSTWNPTAKIGDYVTFTAPMTLRHVQVDGQVVQPGTFFVWDARGKTLSFAGPHDWGSTSLPRWGSPWLEFAPEIRL